MASKRDLALLRRLLQRRKRALLEAATSTDQEVESLRGQTRDPESEESAQVEVADSTLTHLVESERAEVSEIDAALARLDSGSFGLCTECHQPIPVKRLKALPYTPFCEEDAERREAHQHAANPAALPTL